MNKKLLYFHNVVFPIIFFIICLAFLQSHDSIFGLVINIIALIYSGYVVGAAISSLDIKVKDNTTTIYTIHIEIERNDH